MCASAPSGRRTCGEPDRRGACAAQGYDLLHTSSARTPPAPTPCIRNSTTAAAEVINYAGLMNDPQEVRPDPQLADVYVQAYELRQAPHRAAWAAKAPSSTYWSSWATSTRPAPPAGHRGRRGRVSERLHSPRPSPTSPPPPKATTKVSDAHRRQPRT